VVRPVLRRLAEQGIAYRGMLFSGLMVQDGEVNCLEFNVRFGDPETQTIMRRLGSGLAESIAEAARGDGVTPVEVRERAAVTVVVACEGYPGAVEKGRPITIGSLPDEVVVFHAGTAMAPDLVTSGGRVFGVSAIGDSIAEARSRAYEGVDAIRFEGMQFRRDIAGT
jgi:phosphoribosylamine---glycine ligase